MRPPRYIRTRRKGEETAVLVALPTRTDDGGWATAAEVAHAACMGHRRAGAALRRLITAGRIESRPHPTDPALCQYRYVPRGLC